MVSSLTWDHREDFWLGQAYLRRITIDGGDDDECFRRSGLLAHDQGELVVLIGLQRQGVEFEYAVFRVAVVDD